MKATATVQEVLRQFDLDLPSGVCGNGHINTTYLVDSNPRCILQKINTDIFRDPDGVMENISLVTAHLRKKIVEAGRADSVKEEIAFVLDRAADVTVVTDAIAEGSVPLRVTRIDTKLNNHHPKPNITSKRGTIAMRMVLLFGGS